MKTTGFLSGKELLLPIGKELPSWTGEWIDGCMKRTKISGKDLLGIK